MALPNGSDVSISPLKPDFIRRNLIMKSNKEKNYYFASDIDDCQFSNAL